jgi:hypothetical protein
MVTNGKGKKRRYEPPRIYEMEVDMTQAMGASLCTTGNRASGACNTGNRAAANCVNGSRAGTMCNSGSSGAPPVVPCTMGPTPSG